MRKLAGGVALLALLTLLVGGLVLAPSLPQAGRGAVQAAADGPPLEGDFGRAVRPIEDGPLFPDYAFEERRPDGRTRDWGFVELRGKVVIAFFWATWCPVCRRELPKLDELQAELGPEGLVVAALSQDRGGTQAVARYFRERGVENLRVFHDTDRALFASLGLFGVPTTFVVDKNGKMVAVAQGEAPWDSPEAIRFLRHLLNEAPATATVAP